LATFDASDGLAVSTSTDRCSSSDFGHEFLDLMFDVAVGASGGTAVTGLVAWGGEIDFTIFGEMAGLAASSTDDVCTECTVLRTIVLAMTNFAT
jgi:hypothetical protein